MPKKIVLDYELVFDVWSLLFAVWRMGKPGVNNGHLNQVMFKPYKLVLETEAKVKAFESVVSQATPWYPYLELITSLQKEGHSIALRVTSGLPDQFLRGEFPITADLDAADLVISGDLSLPPQNNIRLVRPRKHDAFMHLPLVGELGIFKATESHQFKIDRKGPDFAKNVTRPEYWCYPKQLFEVDIYLEGLVVKGFQRGSKELGCPTANIEMT